MSGQSLVRWNAMGPLRTSVNAVWRQRTAIAVLLFLSRTGSASGHEFWISPSSFQPSANQAVGVTLRVGENHQGQPVKRNSARIERFAACLSDPTSGQLEETPLVGMDGNDPAGEFTPVRPGLYILIYQSNHAGIEMEGEKFDSYLQEKGLDEIRTRRAAQYPGPANVREVYSRCAKSLIMVRGSNSGASLAQDRRTGMPLELVAQFDPYGDSPPGEMRFRVYFEGKPLAGIQVTANTRHAHSAAHRVRSDKDGYLTFRLADPGPWLIECTHMRAAAEDSAADYESFWASLTFELPLATKGHSAAGPEHENE